ncbi:hypothetical protein Fot_22638 [Forsythia ovata]|uniref:Uncharacterized protein n=1 Tax=Forsythia ovata TaxID=205694 RepID=A0ABD1UYB3_9LAMI
MSDHHAANDEDTIGGSTIEATLNANKDENRNDNVSEKDNLIDSDYKQKDPQLNGDENVERRCTWDKYIEYENEDATVNKDEDDLRSIEDDEETRKKKDKDHSFVDKDDFSDPQFETCIL